MKRFSVWILFFLLAAAPVRAADPLSQPPPADWLEQAKLFGPVAQMKGPEVTGWLTTNQLDLSSGYLFDLARRLLADDPDQAMEWYAVAMIRGQYDSRRCIDDTAQRSFLRLSRMAEGVARWGLQHPHDFARAGLKALARPDLLTHRVQPDWICAQGLSGMGGQSAGTRPPALWPAIAQHVTSEYERQFQAMRDR